MSVLTRKPISETFPREFKPLEMLPTRGELGRMIDRFFEEPWMMPMRLATGPVMQLPPIDISETDTELIIRAEIPGIDAKDLEVNIAGNILTFSGEKEATVEQKDEDFYHCERRFGSFRRTVTLPNTVDPERVSAEYSQGVATIRIAKLKTARTRKVEVKETKAGTATGGNGMKG
jgi:HSP20 family protein